MEKIDEILIANILRRMEVLGIRQKELALIAGVNYQGLNRLLNGHGSPSRYTITALAQALGTTFEDLIKVDEPTRNQVDILSPTLPLTDVIDLISGFQSASPEERAVALTLLTGKLEHIDRYPQFGRLLRTFNLMRERR